MKKAILLCIGLGALLLAVLKVGYYTSYEDEESRTTFFLKRTISFRLEFKNIFATEGDDKSLASLRPDERASVIEYCYYRLGIRTSLQTQAELDTCKVR